MTEEKQQIECICDRRKKGERVFGICPIHAKVEQKRLKITDYQKKDADKTVPVSVRISKRHKKFVKDFSISVRKLLEERIEEFKEFEQYAKEQ